MLRRFFIATVFVFTGACGGGGSAPITGPSATPPPVPSPTPTPNPFAAACGTPLPSFSIAYGYGVKVQLMPQLNHWVLNASPRVRSVDYCAAAGIGSFLICNTRVESNPERVPCDHYLSGIADTGKPGPNWYKEEGGRRLRCGGQGIAGEVSGCNLKDGQYLLDIYGPGTYFACAGTGGTGPDNCGGCIIREEDWGRRHNSPAGVCK